jgi:hypothetical protein
MRRRWRRKCVSAIERNHNTNPIINDRYHGNGIESNARAHGNTNARANFYADASAARHARGNHVSVGAEYARSG